MYLNLDPKALTEILGSSTHPQARQILHDIGAQVADAAAPETSKVIEQARAWYAAGSDGDVEIDPDAVVSKGETGFFVQAWVYLPKE